MEKVRYVLNEGGNSNLLKKNKNIVMRKIHGSCFLIDISDKYQGDKCSLLEINETGEFIWKFISDGKEISDVVDALKMSIVEEIDYEILLSDVTEYIQELCRNNFLEVTVAG